MVRKHPCKEWSSAGRIFGLLIVPALLVARPATAQIGQDFNRPQIVLETGGHHAPPRRIVFADDGKRMISAGMDKVVKVWDVTDGRARLVRTLRPPIWRGAAGTVYGMDLAPKPLADDPGQRLLAVAGYGVDAVRGDLALYRFPGRNGSPATGDLVGRLPGPEDRAAGPGKRHLDTVSAVAFGPDAVRLASGDTKGRIIEWDTKTNRAILVLEAHEGPVAALGFLDRDRLVTAGGADGRVRVWDLAEPGDATRARRAADVVIPQADGSDAQARGLNVLAIAPRGVVIVGGEDGRIVRLDPLRPETLTILPRGTEQGPVEAVAISPDGSRYATAIVAKRLKKGEAGRLPTVDCDIEVRSMAEPTEVRFRGRASNLVYALAFGPDARTLVFGGGDGQALTIASLDPADRRPPLEYKGQGASVWKVGWTADGRTVGIGRTRDEVVPAPETADGFDLADRRYVETRPADLSGPILAWDAWTAVPTGALTIEVRRRGLPAFTVTLDRLSDRRWWCWSFIPPAEKAGHAKPTLAVGCEAGVVHYRLEDGRRTRLYAGHEGPVYAIAPSKDGRRMATGSPDQTVRLWTLAGCDTPAPLGAAFENGADGLPRVTKVERFSFAELMGLKVGDVLREGYVATRKAADPATFLSEIETVPPGITLQMMVRRGNADVPLLTTRRDSPAISLFVALDREWVEWTPEGYYDTSIAGDRRYLAWHRNGPDAASPTDVFPAATFEAELRRPVLLSTLFATADRNAALATLGPAQPPDPAALVQAIGPPIVRVAGANLAAGGEATAVNGPTITVAPNVVLTNATPLTSVAVRVDGQLVGPANRMAAPGVAFNAPVTVPVGPGRHRVAIVATNAQGKQRIVGFDVEGNAAPVRKPRMAVLAIGVKGPFSGEADLPTIRFADEDARDLAAFLGEFGRTSYADVTTYPPLADTGATAAAITEAFGRVKKDGFGAGDTLLVTIESHFLAPSSGTPALVGSDAANKLSAAAIADALAERAADGCRVVLLIDAVHENAANGTHARLSEWVRSLDRRGVVAFIASNHGPSRRHLPTAHGAFAEAVLEVRDARSQSRPWVDAKSGFTLDDFKTTVVDRVQELTRRKQQPALYLPETLSAQSPLFAAPR